LKKNKPFFFGGDEQLSVDRVANLLIPLMGAIYGKQQVAELQGDSLTLSESFRAVVRDILTLSTEIVQLDQEIRNKEGNGDTELVN